MLRHQLNGDVVEQSRSKEVHCMTRFDLESLCQSQNRFVSDKDLTCDNQLLCH